jgi:dihydroorotase
MKNVDCTGKIISPGFIDIHAHFREPGREDKETLETGAKAALYGGFTRVCVMPNTNPPLDSPESINFIIEKSINLPVKIFPIGSITQGQRGDQLTEIGEMVSAGAVAISDDGLPVQNGQVLRYAYEYAKKFGIPVINHAEDIYLRNNGVMNEGSLSTRLGLPGNPDISESVMVHRDLEIADFCDGRIHVPHVSTRRSVDLIRKYKSMGLNVTAEVTPHHLGLTEEKLLNYNTHAKVAPPLRSALDREALIKGLIDGTIDCIATDHAPHTIEDKEMDFIHAPCGMIGLESAFGLCHTIMTHAGSNSEEIIQWFTNRPASVMGWDLEAYPIGGIAEIVIIDSKKKWIFNESDIMSRSKNSPIVGMEFTGKVEAVISGKYAIGTLLD